MKVEIGFYEGEGYQSMISYEGWKVACLKYAKRFDQDMVDRMERHLLTDEVFVLLDGEAFLIIGEDEKVCSMEKNKLYNVKKAVWHAICVSKDALVLIVENAETGPENTEYRELSSGWKKQLNGKKRFFLGIDGGGTKTDLLLVDETGKMVRSLKVGACNPVDIGFEASKTILQNAIIEICQDIPFSDIYMFAGIAGGTSAGMQVRFHAFFEEFRFGAFANDSDIKNIMAAGLGKCDGIVMILGTGICAFTQKNGVHTRVAGWGYLIDNGGSGYNLGRDALNAYFCAIDGTEKKTALTEEIDVVYPGGANKIMEFIYCDGKKAVASFAPTVFSAIEKGDEIAKEILERNIKAAVHILETAAGGFSEGKIPVILAGGLTNQPSVVNGIRASLKEPARFELQKLEAAPVNGAVMLARELKGEENNAQN